VVMKPTAEDIDIAIVSCGADLPGDWCAVHANGETGLTLVEPLIRGQDAPFKFMR
jgi:hypothetical protein